MSEYIVHGDQFVNVRPDPSTVHTPLGVLPTGTHVDVTDVVNGWARVRLLAGQSSLTWGDGTPAYGYMLAALLAAATPVPPPQVVIPPASPHLLGVNVIYNAAGAYQVSDLGCKAFVIMDHPDVCEAIKLAHPSAVVVNRRWTNDPLTGQQFWDKFGASCNTGVINEYLNEAQVYPYGTVDQIRNRIDQELAYYNIARSRGALVALGCYSMGTPEFSDTGIVEQVKRYAHYYNTDAGCFFSMHNYSPNMGHIDNDADLIWYEKRFQFLFDKCGFDPAQRKLIMTETGVDEGGVGGFPAHNATAAQFSHWCTRYMQVMTNTPVMASMIFAYTQGTNSQWQGYDVGALRDELKAAAQW